MFVVLVPCMEQQYYNVFGSPWQEWQADLMCLVGAVVINEVDIRRFSSLVFLCIFSFFS